MFRTGQGSQELQAAYQFPRKLLSVYNPQWTLDSYCAYFVLEKLVKNIDKAHNNVTTVAGKNGSEADNAKAKTQLDEAAAAFFDSLKDSFATVRNHLIEQENLAEKLLEQIRKEDLKTMRAHPEATSARLEECYKLLRAIHMFRTINAEAFRRLFEQVLGLKYAIDSLELHKKIRAADEIIINSAIGSAVLDTDRASDVVLSIYSLVHSKSFEQSVAALELAYNKDPNTQARMLPMKTSINYTSHNQRYKSPQGSFSARLLVGSASLELGKDVEQMMSSTMMKTTLGVFANGEVSITLDEPARGEDVFILESIYSTATHYTNEHTKPKSLSTILMELLLLVQTVKQSSACRVTIVVPFLPYNNRTAEGSLIAEFMMSMGVDCVLTIDMHRDQGAGNFSEIPVYNISMQSEFTHYLAKHYLNMIPDDQEIVVVAPDGEALGRARKFADELGMLLLSEDSARKANAPAATPASTTTTGGGGRGQAFPAAPRSIGICTAIKSPRGGDNSVDIIGDATNKVCILVDTLIDEGTKLWAVSKHLRENCKAVSVIAVATHALFSGDAATKLLTSNNSYNTTDQSPLDLIVTSDSIGSNKDLLTNPKIASKLRILPSAPILTQAIQRLHSDSAVSSRTLDK